MKKRVITGAVSALYAVFLLISMNKIPGVMSVTIGFFSAIAAHELMGVSKCKNKVLTYVSMACAACVPLYIDFELYTKLPIPPVVLVTVYILALFIIMLKMYDQTKFEHVGLALTGSLLIPIAISAIFFVKGLYVAYPTLFTQSQSVFILLCAFYSAWMSDTWAYFVGRKLGKHKLAPKISPKKSVEGFIGGCFGNALFCSISYFVCKFAPFANFENGHIKFWMVFCVAIVLSAMGTLGDLTASVIKRNYGEKDYGTFFPGHGGVMDRMDSLIFVMPSLWVILKTATTFAA